MNRHDISDDIARRAAEDAKREVDREIARELNRKQLGERDDDFEPNPDYVPPAAWRQPEERPKLTREQRLAALERGLGRELGPKLRSAMLGPPPKVDEPVPERPQDRFDEEEPRIDYETGEILNPSTPPAEDLLGRLQDSLVEHRQLRDGEDGVDG